MPAPTDSYLNEFLYTELADVVGPENVSTSQADKIAYSCDYYWTAELWIDRGRRSPEPDAVVHPRSVEEVSRICRIASKYKLPLTTWGGGSGSQGGALPIHGGIVLDTKKLNRILEIDKDGAYLVFGFDGDRDLVELEMAKALAVCRSLPHEDLGPDLGQNWWDHRYDFFFPNHMFHLPQAAMQHGGLLNEHHGIGLKLGRLMRELYGPAYGVLKDIKRAVDPHNIMNPGKMGFPAFR